MYKLLSFDVYGTLINTPPINVKAFRLILEQAGASNIDALAFISVLGKPQHRPLSGAVPQVPRDRAAFARRSVREFRHRGRNTRSYRAVLRIIPGNAAIP